MEIEEKIREMAKAKVPMYLASQRLGIYREKFDAIVEAMGLVWPSRHRTYVLDGVEDTIAGHARRLGIGRTRLSNRLKAGIDHHIQIVRSQVTDQDVERFMYLREAGIPAWQAAVEVGHHYNTLRKHALGNPRYAEVMKAVKRVRRTPKQINEGFSLPIPEQVHETPLEQGNP